MSTSCKVFNIPHHHTRHFIPGYRYPTIKVFNIPYHHTRHFILRYRYPTIKLVTWHPSIDILPSSLSLQSSSWTPRFLTASFSWKWSISRTKTPNCILFFSLPVLWFNFLGRDFGSLCSCRIWWLELFGWYDFFLFENGFFWRYLSNYRF